MYTNLPQGSAPTVVDLQAARGTDTGTTGLDFEPSTALDEILAQADLMRGMRLKYMRLLEEHIKTWDITLEQATQLFISATLMPPSAATQYLLCMASPTSPFRPGGQRA